MSDADPSSRPASFEDRYRLYLDESGDHVFRETQQLSHRFLALLGCWFRNPDYVRFHQALETLKYNHLSHHPDEPVVLHREDMVNARRAFKILRDEEKRKAFDADLLRVIQQAQFTMVVVVIDKQALKSAYGDAAAHPYHLALGFLLQRYVGYLNRINRIGDVMAEARGGKEDRLLAESYTRIYEQGVWMTKASAFQAALSSRQLKLKDKRANIAGLQLADILAYPVKLWVLHQYGLAEPSVTTFGHQLVEIAQSKFNCHLYNGRAEGYGFVLFPRPQK
ncbi:MAG: hypothetical protein KatS3mg051_0832 [Anaerolineae bacterium]|nr:MAG: hypothetical protein KatS3mg051_0832 [Anaerolineae bacterium]